MATALVNVAFGFGSSMVWFSCFWALNGILQVLLLLLLLLLLKAARPSLIIRLVQAQIFFRVLYSGAEQLCSLARLWQLKV